MRFGINLRGDLAKLDDAEIASRYEALISETETKHRATRAHASGRVIYRIWKGSMGRGLFHGRVFYKVQAFLLGGFVAIVGQEVLTETDLELYFLNCELKDVRDEIKRRIRYRKTAAATS
jgi:hypothetical protein